MVEEYRLFILKEKAVYHNLNQMKQAGFLVRSTCWCPVSEEQNVQKTLLTLADKYRTSATPQFIKVHDPPKLKHPTYIPVNEFTFVFQVLPYY